MKLRMLATAFLLATLGFAFPVTATEKLGGNTIEPSVLQAQSKWQTFTSEVGKFQISLPRKPSPQSTQAAEWNGKPIQLHQISTQNSNGAYIVVYADLPSTNAQTDTEKTLDEISTKLLSEMKLQELKGRGKTIEINGNPGREYRISNSGRVFAMRLYLVGQRSYLLLSQSSNSGEANQFLSSFQLL
jgi:hypothetical protein